MTLPFPLTAFLVTGVLFGLFTFAHRHHFSEGSTRPADAADNTLLARLGWLALSTLLWPVLALTGLYGLALRKRVPVKGPRNPPQ
jgi:hypothetical protein